MRGRIKEIIQKKLNTKWLSVTEAVRTLNEAGIRMTAPTLLKLVNNKELPGKRIGARYFIPAEAIEKLLTVEEENKNE